MDVLEKETIIRDLKEKLDSINKVKIQTIQKPKNLINNKKIILEKKDTVIPQKIDSVPQIIIDTTSNWNKSNKWETTILEKDPK